MDSFISESMQSDIITNFSTDNLITLSQRDFNRISSDDDATIMYADTYKELFGTLTELNENESYMYKISTFAAYDKDLNDNPELSIIITLLNELLINNNFNLLDNHYRLEIVTHLLAYFGNITSSHSINYYANDGMVPLQSALFLDISEGIPFANNSNDYITTIQNNITNRKQVQSHYIFTDNVQDHLDLLDTDDASYWEAVSAQIEIFNNSTYGCTDPNASNYNVDATIDDGSCEDLSISDLLVPKESSIKNIYPNPFNPIVNIEYGIPEYTNVEIMIFDLSGKQIALLLNKIQYPGSYSINWNAEYYPSGIFFIQITTKNDIITKKITLIK